MEYEWWFSDDSQMLIVINNDMDVFHKWGYGDIPKWKVYKGKTHWMIWGYPYFRKPPNELYLWGNWKAIPSYIAEQW